MSLKNNLRITLGSKSENFTNIEAQQKIRYSYKMCVYKQLVPFQFIPTNFSGGDCMSHFKRLNTLFDMNRCGGLAVADHAICLNFNASMFFNGIVHLKEKS